MGHSAATLLTMMFAALGLHRCQLSVVDMYHGVVWCGVVWCGVVWCGVVWCGVVWCGVVWCGVVWCGVVCLRPTASTITTTHHIKGGQIRDL